MKNITFFIVALLLGAAVSAQAPQSFRYQAVARDNSGNILANRDVSFRISILSTSISGAIVYSEIHAGKSTNAFGLVDLEIGRGTPDMGSFELIEWGNNSYFVKIEIDPAGGSAYQVLSTSQMLSVPYALHAKTVQTGDNWGSDNVKTDVTLSGNGTSGNLLKIADNEVTSAKIANGTIATADLSDMAVNSAKIQDGSITTSDLAGDVITTWKILDGTISANDIGSNAITTDKIVNGAVTGNKIAQAGATSGQVFKWNGTLWVPGNDELINSQWLQNGNNIYYNSGFVGIGTANPVVPLEVASSGIPHIKLNNTSGNAGNVQKITFWKGSTEKFSIGFDLWNVGDDLFTLYDTPNQLPVFNIINGNIGIGTTNPNSKLEVSTSSTNPALQVTNNGSGEGIKSIAASASKTGIIGEAPNQGIFGFATATTGAAYGVKGTSASSSGSGVTGFGSSATGENFGVRGLSASNTGIGVYGQSLYTGVYAEATATSGYSFGLQGIAASINGIGVLGRATSGSGYTVGVRGAIDSPNGYGVQGVSYANSGTGKGIYGSTDSPAGYSGYFNGGQFYVGGNVGIGTENPVYRLVVHAPGTTSTGIASFNNSDGDSKVVLRQNSNGCGAVNIYKTGNEATISIVGEGNSYINGGRLGIGTTAPTQLLDINGGVRARGLTTGTVVAGVYLTSDGTFVTGSSDIRLKENIEPLQSSLNKVIQLNGVSFTWKTDPNKKRNIGFIAQEFEKIIPELVFTNETDGYKGINYAEVSAVLVEAIKELKAENDQLKAENELVNSRLEKIEAVIKIKAENFQQY